MLEAILGTCRFEPMLAPDMGGFGNMNPMMTPMGQAPPIQTGFFPTTTGFGVGYNNLLPQGGGDYHDTFKVDRYDNLYGGHGTLQTPNGMHNRLTNF